jgi:hypothetical protein
MPTTWFAKGGIYGDLSRIDPAELDTDQWVDVAVSMGAKYIIFVAKHGPGFRSPKEDPADPEFIGEPRGHPWEPVECDTTLRYGPPGYPPKWGWEPNQENLVRTVDQLMELYYTSDSKAGRLRYHERQIALVTGRGCAKRQRLPEGLDQYAAAEPPRSSSSMRRKNTVCVHAW